MSSSSRKVFFWVAITLCFTVLFCPDRSNALGFDVDLKDSSYYYDMWLKMGDEAPIQAEAHWTGTTNQSFSQKLTLYEPYYFDYVSAEPFALTAQASTYDTSSFGNVFVSGTWLFQPIENADRLPFLTHNPAFHHCDWTAFYIVLNDITDSNEIFNGASLGQLDSNYLEWWFGDSWEGPVEDTGFQDWNWAGQAINNNFYTDHIYELKMGVVSNSNDDDPYLKLTACMDVASVPEPSTILLLGTGMIGLAGWVRKKVR